MVIKMKKVEYLGLGSNTPVETLLVALHVT